MALICIIIIIRNVYIRIAVLRVINGHILELRIYIHQEAQMDHFYLELKYLLILSPIQDHF